MTPLFRRRWVVREYDAEQTNLPPLETWFWTRLFATAHAALINAHESTAIAFVDRLERTEVIG